MFERVLRSIKMLPQLHLVERLSAKLRFKKKIPKTTLRVLWSFATSHLLIRIGNHNCFNGRFLHKFPRVCPARYFHFLWGQSGSTDGRNIAISNSVDLRKSFQDVNTTCGWHLNIRGRSKNHRGGGLGLFGKYDGIKTQLFTTTDPYIHIYNMSGLCDGAVG